MTAALYDEVVTVAPVRKLTWCATDPRPGRPRQEVARRPDNPFLPAGTRSSTGPPVC